MKQYVKCLLLALVVTCSAPSVAQLSDMVVDDFRASPKGGDVAMDRAADELDEFRRFASRREWDLALTSQYATAKGSGTRALLVVHLMRQEWSQFYRVVERIKRGSASGYPELVSPGALGVLSNKCVTTNGSRLIVHSTSKCHSPIVKTHTLSEADKFLPGRLKLRSSDYNYSAHSDLLKKELNLPDSGIMAGGLPEGFLPRDYALLIQADFITGKCSLAISRLNLLRFLIKESDRGNAFLYLPLDLYVSSCGNTLPIEDLGPLLHVIRKDTDTRFSSIPLVMKQIYGSLLQHRIKGDLASVSAIEKGKESCKAFGIEPTWLNEDFLQIDRPVLEASIASFEGAQRELLNFAFNSARQCVWGAYSEVRNRKK